MYQHLTQFETLHRRARLATELRSAGEARRRRRPLHGLLLSGRRRARPVPAPC